MAACWGFGVVLASGGACGGAQFTQAESPDAASDAHAGDSALPDAEPLADVAVDAPGPSFCAKLPDVHFFCDDFDRRADGNTQGKWDAFIASPKGDVQLDTTQFVSDPRSLLAQTTQTTGMNSLVEQTSALLIKNLPPSTDVRMTAEVFVEAYGSQGLESSSIISVGSTALQYALIASQKGAAVVESSSVDGGPQSALHFLKSGFPLGQWVLLELVLTLPTAQSAGHVQVFLEKSLVLDDSLAQDANIGAANLIATLGLQLKMSSALWKVHYDNVIIDRQ